MPITRETITDSINVLEDGQMRVQEATWFVEDGVRVGTPTYHRYIVDVGDDLTGKDQLVKDTANNLHTPARKAKRDALKAERIASLQQNLINNGA